MRKETGWIMAALVALAAAPPASAAGADPAAEPDPWAGVASTTIADRFNAADQARDSRDHALAERRYRALIAETQGELQIEARFRLAMMLDQLARPAEAVAELRLILAEKPDAQGLRVILARMLAQSGERSAAAREFRRAEAAGLPGEIQAVVRQFAAALRTAKPVGGSLGLALVGDSNVNRATASDTVETIIAPFQLSEDARAQPGVGASLSGQLYARAPLAGRLKLLARLSGQGDLYGQARFNDLRGAGQLGLEWQMGADRLAPSVGRSWRWFGGVPYAITDTLSLGWRHKAGNRALIEGTIAVGQADYTRNDALDGRVYDLSLRYERAFSARHGASLTLSAQRQAAADPGYATASAGFDALYWRQAGPLSLFGSVGLNHLEADERQALFPHRRSDWLVSAMLGASLARHSLAGFTPLVRASYTRNSSTVTLYGYSRVRLELGMSRSF